MPLMVFLSVQPGRGSCRAAAMLHLMARKICQRCWMVQKIVLCYLGKQLERRSQLGKGWTFSKLHLFLCLMRSGPCFHDFPRRIPRLAVHGRLKATSASQSGACRTAMGWGRILHLVVGFFVGITIIIHIWSYMYVFVYRIDDDNDDDDIMVYIYIYERERSKQQWWGKIEKSWGILGFPAHKTRFTRFKFSIRWTKAPTAVAFRPPGFGSTSTTNQEAFGQGGACAGALIW